MWRGWKYLIKLGQGDSVKSRSGCSQHALLWFILSFFSLPRLPADFPLCGFRLDLKVVPAVYPVMAVLLYD